MSHVLIRGPCASVDGTVGPPGMVMKLDSWDGGLYSMTLSGRHARVSSLGVSNLGGVLNSALCRLLPHILSI